MTKKLGVQLMIAGLSLQLVDVATSGKLFGAGGWLAGIDAAVPKLTLPWPAGVQTNVAFWLIVAGAGIWLAKR